MFCLGGEFLVVPPQWHRVRSGSATLFDVSIVLWVTISPCAVVDLVPTAGPISCQTRRLDQPHQPWTWCVDHVCACVRLVMFDTDLLTPPVKISRVGGAHLRSPLGSIGRRRLCTCNCWRTYRSHEIDGRTTNSPAINRNVQLGQIYLNDTCPDRLWVKI